MEAEIARSGLEILGNAAIDGYPLPPPCYARRLIDNALEKSGGKVLSKLHVPVGGIANDAYTLLTLPETPLTPESVLRIHGTVEIPIGGLTNYDDPESLKRPFAVHLELRQDKRFRTTLLSRVFLTSK